MENERLLVWLELVPDGSAPVRSGVLCRRHADAMIVPRGWTLDDRREPMPRLFKVADTSDAISSGQKATANHPSRGRSKPRPLRNDDAPLQLVFDERVDRPELDEIDSAAERPEVPVPVGITVGKIRPSADADADPDETRALPWRPVFDADDDLGGLLNASSPLLSRAFRTRSAPPPEPT